MRSDGQRASIHPAVSSTVRSWARKTTPMGTLVRSLLRYHFTTAACLSILLILTLGACGGDSQEKEVAQSLVFEVERSLLTPLIHDSTLSISFSAPRGWNMLSKELLKQGQDHARRRAGAVGQATVFSPVISCAWNDTLSGSVMTVSLFPGFDTSDSSRTIREYKDYFESRRAGVDVTTTVFTSNGFRVHQVRVLDSDRILFKMIFSDKGLPTAVQFDFSIPKGSSQLIRTIESVAGSIERM